jgi:predicted methyltransferase
MILLTKAVHDTLAAARATLNDRPGLRVTVSLNLGRSDTPVDVMNKSWRPAESVTELSYCDGCRDHTVYYWHEGAWEPVQRYTTALIKLVPTEWGPPTFEIDGIKMLPTAQVSPWIDAQRKVALVAPRGKAILDCCGGLGYFAAAAIQAGAARILSFEKNPDVIWLRGINPWSPQAGSELTLENHDISAAIRALPDAGFDAVLHDPPRFGIAGELYSQAFYDQLARVLKRRGRLFHYTGTPNRLTSGRDVPGEVTRRLQRSGFTVKREGDGLIAVRN